jgi:hypothetical protein
MGKSDDNRSYIVRGYWNPLARAFKDLTLLNEETPKGKLNILLLYYIEFDFFKVLVYF